MGHRRPVADPGQWWQIVVTLDRIPAVKAVQFAVFPNDPTSQFRVDLERVEAVLEDATAGSEGNEDARRRLMVVWNALFRSIRGDQVYVVTPRSQSDETVTAVGVRSNEVAGERWLVTKAVNSDGRALCWCLPFSAGGGAATRFALDDRNALDLSGLAAGQ